MGYRLPQGYTGWHGGTGYRGVTGWDGYLLAWEYTGWCGIHRLAQGYPAKLTVPISSHFRVLE